MTRHATLLFGVLLCCSGCHIGQPYQRPAAPTPPDFKELADSDQWKIATPNDDLPKGKWWEMFGDPQLNGLEELVEINNQNVKQAEANFRAAVDEYLAFCAAEGK